MVALAKGSYALLHVHPNDFAQINRKGKEDQPSETNGTAH